MINPHPLDSLAESFWTRPELVNAWRLCFEDDAHRIPLLMRVVRHLPTERGRLEFLDETTDGRFVLLITHDITNVRSWENQAWILSVLVETRAVTAIAVEGSIGPFDFTKFRLPDRQRTRQVAVQFLRECRMGATPFVGITTSESVAAYGIDDPELYKAASTNVLAKNTVYYDAIRRRAPRLLENMLSGMAERKLSVVAVCLTDYNYDEFRWMLRERRIAHAGIRPRVDGPIVSFEEFWKKMWAPKPGVFRRAVHTVRRWIGL